MPDEKGIVSKSKLTALATKIKTKAGTSGTYTLDELVDVVDDIETGGVTPTGTKQVSITQNGTTTEDVTNYASAEITVNVPSSGITPSGTIQITENGTVDVTQYASAAVNVSGGGAPEWFNKVSSIFFSLETRTIYGDVEFDFGSVPVLFSAARTKSTIAGSKIIVRCGELAFNTSALSGYKTTTNITDYIFYCSNDPAAASEFSRETKALRILTPGHALLVTSFGTGNYRKFNGTSLQEFYLVPNKVTAGEGGINTGELIDDSLVSVANALVGGLSTPQTLTISNAATKAKCSTIVGSVSQVTDDSGTYDFFTQDQGNGTVTLLDFITNTKGWTVA